MLGVILYRKCTFNGRFLLRREFKDFLEIMAYDSSNSETSNEDEDMGLLFYHLVFPPKPPRQARVSLHDFSELECEQLFR